MANPRNKGISLAEYFFAIMSLFSVVTFFLNATGAGGVHDNISSSSSVSGSVTTAAVGLHASLSTSKTSFESMVADTTSIPSDPNYSLAGLSCDAFGGPSPANSREMVYWEDIPSDNKHASPYRKLGVGQYLTFEPDKGGFNNIRMAMETVLALAFAMGRTLVLPPEQPMYLLSKKQNDVKGGKQQRTAFSFNHFFHMEAIHNEHTGLDIITMKEFLETEAMTGHLVDSVSGKASFPPGNRTAWDGAKTADVAELFGWLRTTSYLAVWDPDECLAVFPGTSDPHDIEELEAMRDTILLDEPRFEDFIGKPTPVDAPAMDRMRENWAGRKKLCIYDEKMQAAPLVHFPVNPKMHARLLVHFYALLFFQDWKQDLWMKRFIRDHVRYVDEIQCAAARVVHAIRQRARKRDPIGNPDGLFDSFHVRRGDFQYKKTRVSAAEIYEQSKKVLAENATVYIATDERYKKFFDDMAKHYDLVFLDDVLLPLGDVNTNYYGMIDQLIASRGRNFFGCWFSTFTVSLYY